MAYLSSPSIDFSPSPKRNPCSSGSDETKDEEEGMHCYLESIAFRRDIVNGVQAGELEPYACQCNEENDIEQGHHAKNEQRKVAHEPPSDLVSSSEATEAIPQLFPHDCISAPEDEDCRADVEEFPDWDEEDVAESDSAAVVVNPSVDDDDEVPSEAC